jgi:DNA-binding ferritin-like protein
MPSSISDVVAGSHVSDYPVEGNADELLATVRDDLDHLKGCYEELIAVADAEGHKEIANYAQDQVLDLAKSIWMIDSTLS